MSVIPALERLVRERTITGYEVPHGSAPVVLHVIVDALHVITNPHLPGYNREKLETFRGRVTRELEPYRGERDVLVSVRGLR